jgi:hypothetical protein
MTSPIKNSVTQTAPILSGGVIGGALVGLGIYGLAIAAASALSVALIASGIGGLIAGVGIGLLIWFLMNRQTGACNVPSSPASGSPVNSDPQDVQLQPLNIPHVPPNGAELPQTDPIILPEPSEPSAPPPQMDPDRMWREFLNVYKPIHIEKSDQYDFCTKLNLPGVCLGASLVWVNARLNAGSSQAALANLGGWESLLGQALTVQAFYTTAALSQVPNRFAHIGAQPMVFGGQGGGTQPSVALNFLGLKAGKQSRLRRDNEVVNIVGSASHGYACEIGLQSNSGGHSIAIVKGRSHIELFDANLGIWKIPSEMWSEFFSAFRSSLYPEYRPVTLLPLGLK